MHTPPHRHTCINIFIYILLDAGCTESEPTIVYTDPTLPQGLLPPTATPHSTSYASILWAAPQYPNGPNIRYELARSTIRQPLERK